MFCFAQVVLSALVAVVISFQVPQQSSPSRTRSALFMKWSFSKGMGTMSDLGLVGAEGEYYFHPSKKATLKYPQQVALKESTAVAKGAKPAGLKTVPIFPYNRLCAMQLHWFDCTLYWRWFG